MVLLDHLWDDTVTRPQSQRSLNKVYIKPFNIKDIRVEGSSKYQRSLSMPRKENVWWSVFHPGSTKTVGANPTVYDWLYSGETRSKHHEKV